MSEDAHHLLMVKSVVMLALIIVSFNFISFLKLKGRQVSETSVFIIIGFIVGFIFVNTTQAIYKDDIYNRDIQLSSNFFYMVLLPPIIFESGFTIQRVTFVRNLVPILALALFGAMYSAIVTSLVVYGSSRLIYPSLTFLESLVFGSFISSTDPVSVLGMLPPNTDRNLYMLIFGESALNDAVALILFRLFTTLVINEKHLTPSVFLLSIGQSLWIFVGSVMIGVSIALAFALLTKYVKPPETPIFEQIMFFTFAYISYILADLVGVTGIISVFFCGFAMAHYAYHNMSKVSLLSSKVVLRAFASMCDAFVFMYLGLGVFAFGATQTRYDVAFIFACLFAILLGRTHVFAISWIHNWVSNRINQPNLCIPAHHQTFLWLCGLRGAVAFALSIDLLGNDAFPQETRALLFGTTIAIISVTIIGLGAVMPYAMEHLNITEVKQDPDAPKHQADNNSLEEYMPSNAELNTAELTGFWVTALEYDKKYLVPFFGPSINGYRRQSSLLSHNSRASGDGSFKRNSATDMIGDDDSELDKISIGAAAEMIGMPGSTIQSMQNILNAPGGTRRDSDILRSSVVESTAPNEFRMIDMNGNATNSSSAKIDLPETIQESGEESVK